MRPPFGKTVMIMRHAEAEAATESDHQRGLDRAGKDQARVMGRLLLQRGPLPDLLLHSDASRTRETASLLVETLEVAVTAESVATLYFSGAEEILALLRALPQDKSTLLLIGHNPAVSEFCQRIRGGGKPLGPLDPAAIACFDLSRPQWDTLAWGEALCRWFLTPAEAAYTLKD